MKKFINLLIIIVLGFSLSGCFGAAPQSAEEYRKAIGAGGFLTKFETFEVNRSYKKVSKIFKKQAKKCLNMSVKTTTSSRTGYGGVMRQVMITDYNTKVKVGKKRTELAVQQHHTSAGMIKLSKEPEGGYFFLVADATRIGKNKTKIDIYSPSIGVKTMLKAIKGWATGKVKGCPDLTK